MDPATCSHYVHVAASRLRSGKLQGRAAGHRLPRPTPFPSPMAVPHATPGQVLDVRPLGERLRESKTTALFKSRDLEVMRLVLVEGKSLPSHKVPGEITIHCLEGRLAIGLEGATVPLEAGELVHLAGNAVHGVTALADATALVTVALKA